MLHAHAHAHVHMYTHTSHTHTHTHTHIAYIVSARGNDWKSALQGRRKTNVFFLNLNIAVFTPNIYCLTFVSIQSLKTQT